MTLNIGLVMSGFLLVLAVTPRYTDASETKTSKTSSSVDNSFTPTFSKGGGQDSNSKTFKSNKVFISSKPIETSSSSITSEIKEMFVNKNSESNQNRGRSGSGSGGRGLNYGVLSNYPRTAPASSSYGRK